MGVVYNLARQNVGEHSCQHVHDIDVRSRLDQSGALLFSGFDMSPETIEQFADLFLVREQERRRGLVARSREAVIGAHLPRSEFYGIPSIMPRTVLMHHQSEDRERCEVTVADGVELFSQLRDETVDFLTHHCLRIDMCFRFATWKILFGGHGYFQELASHFPDLFYSFSSDGSLFVRSIASAINRTKSGEYAVVSPLLGILSGNSFYRATLEDGSSLPSEICDELLGVLTQVTVRVPWRPDTFLLVDNARVMCGHDALCDKRIVTRYAMPTPHRSLKSWHLH